MKLSILVFFSLVSILAFAEKPSEEDMPYLFAPSEVEGVLINVDGYAADKLRSTAEISIKNSKNILGMDDYSVRMLSAKPAEDLILETKESIAKNKKRVFKANCGLAVAAYLREKLSKREDLRANMSNIANTVSNSMGFKDIRFKEADDGTYSATLTGLYGTTPFVEPLLKGIKCYDFISLNVEVKNGVLVETETYNELNKVGEMLDGVYFLNNFSKFFTTEKTRCKKTNLVGKETHIDSRLLTIITVEEPLLDNITVVNDLIKAASTES